LVIKVLVLLLSAFLLAGCIVIFYGPFFLNYADKPVKSDVVVLFLGDEHKTREMQAEKLLREGYARYLVIPASGEIQQLTPDGKLKRVSRDLKVGDLLFKLRKRAIYGKHYEDTHIEVLEAKRIMDESGFRSAILVSSPYHMRRIRMIAGKVFKGGKYNFNCIPSIFEKPFDASDWCVRDRRGIMVSEYVKICWFMLYRIFG
jgi:uncharacterized SAM-binding protein YcdF (DUF218 family)